MIISKNKSENWLIVQLHSVHSCARSINFSFSNFPSAFLSSPGIRPLPYRRWSSTCSKALRFPKILCAKSPIFYHIFLYFLFFFVLRLLPFLLEFQLVVKLGLLILHPAGQDQIIVRDVPLMQHGHVFLLPVDHNRMQSVSRFSIIDSLSTC